MPTTEGSAHEQFSQIEKYEALATKLGVTDADKEGARFNGSFTLQPGDTLGKKLLEQYGNTTDGRRKMASMLVQMAQAGFNVDYVKAGEKVEFKGNEVVITQHNNEKITLNLDGAATEIKDKSRHAIEGMTRDVAAGLALEIYNLYLTAQAGGDVENWEKQKEYFIEGLIKAIVTASEVPAQSTKLNFVQAQLEKIAGAERDHGKGSAEYNIAIINLVKQFKGQMNAEEMAAFWDWVTQYVKEKSNPAPRAPEPVREPPREVIDEARKRAFGDATEVVRKYIEGGLRYKNVRTNLTVKSNTKAELTVNFDFKKEPGDYKYILTFDERQNKVVISSAETDLKGHADIEKLQRKIDRAAD